jgi:hypothetical protein
MEAKSAPAALLWRNQATKSSANFLKPRGNILFHISARGLLERRVTRIN